MNLRTQFVAVMLALGQASGSSVAQKQEPDNTYHPISCSARTSDSLLLVTGGKLWDLATWKIDPQNGAMHGRALNVDYNFYSDAEKYKDDSKTYVIDIDATFDKAALLTFSPAAAKHADDDHPPIPTRITRVVITHKTGDDKAPSTTTVYNLKGAQLVLEDSAATDPVLKAMPLTSDKPGKQSVFILLQRMTVWVSANDALASYAKSCGPFVPEPQSDKPVADAPKAP